MSEPLQAFLSKRLGFPGVAAWSLRHADKTLYHQCQAKWLSDAKLAVVLTRMFNTVELLAKEQLEPVRLNWVFEKMRLHLALRGDGTALALFIQPLPQMPGAAVDAVLTEFLTMKPG